jgi:hypothetical protein
MARSMSSGMDSQSDVDPYACKRKQHMTAWTAEPRKLVRAPRTCTSVCRIVTRSRSVRGGDTGRMRWPSRRAHVSSSTMRSEQPATGRTTARMVTQTREAGAGAAAGAGAGGGLIGDGGGGATQLIDFLRGVSDQYTN